MCMLKGANSAICHGTGVFLIALKISLKIMSTSHILRSCLALLGPGPRKYLEQIFKISDKLKLYIPG